MAKYGAADTVTGSAFRVKAVQTTSTALVAPVVKEEDLRKKGHPINITRMSGKQKGAIVVVEKADKSLYLAIAEGPADTDKWHPTTVGAAVTPAA